MDSIIVNSSPHRHSGASVPAIMTRVAIALTPGLAVYAWLFGPAVLVQCVLACLTAVVVEALAMRWRGRPAASALRDRSVLVTALLLAVSISPLAPWWATIIATVVAVALTKHAFGGLGQNLFNPAMAGFVFVLLCFPAQMNQWPVPGGALSTAADSTAETTVDATSGASALNHMKSRLGLMEMVGEIRAAPLYGTMGGRGWEWVALAWLAGGIALLTLRVIRWHIPAGFVAGMTLVSGITWMLDADVYAAPLFHLVTPSAMLGAFFIATDSVSAAMSDRGRLIYGACIGAMTCVLRLWGAYPDGVAFAVLLGNACVPIIDRFTQPPVLGVRS